MEERHSVFAVGAGAQQSLHTGEEKIRVERIFNVKAEDYIKNRRNDKQKGRWF